MADTASTRRPIRDGLLAGHLDDLSTVRLAGSRCATCGETALGQRAMCAQCADTAVEHIALGARGTLWTYTVVRHRPPGDYRGPDPFEPFGLGLVEMPEGIRVLGPIRGCAPDTLRIGMPLTFVPYVRVDPDGSEVVAFAFEPTGAGGANA